MLYLVGVLVMMAVTTTAGSSGHAMACPPTPSVCGFIEGATRFYVHQMVADMVVVVHEDADSAERFVAGVTGIESQ